MKSKKGLTLVEILAVLVVLGLVLGIAIPNIVKYKKKMDEKNKNNTIIMILNAAHKYYAENHTLSSVTPNFLKTKGYVNFKDELGSVLPDVAIIRKKCDTGNNNQFYFYLYKGTGEWKLNNYNDCGCEQQVGGSTVKELCENTQGTY